MFTRHWLNFETYIALFHTDFTPLILSTSGGMGPECAIFVKHLAKKIAQKKNQDLPDVMRVLRTEIRFAVLKATLIAIRGTRGSLYQKKTDEDADVDYNVVALDCKDDFLN